MKKILLLTAILVMAFTVNAIAAPPATGDIDVTVTAPYLGYVTFYDNATSTSTTLDFDDYTAGSKALTGAAVADDTVQWWANSTSQITFDVDVTSVSSGAGNLGTSSFSFSSDANNYGDTSTLNVGPGTQTLAVDQYLVDGISWALTPPDTYTITFTGTIANI
jgi:hypothetical protein